MTDSWALSNKVDSTDSDGIPVAPAVDDATGAIYRSRNVRFEDNVIQNAGHFGGGYGVEVKRSDGIHFSRTSIGNLKAGAWNSATVAGAPRATDLWHLCSARGRRRRSR